MDLFLHKFLKRLRRMYPHSLRGTIHTVQIEKNPEIVSEVIYQLLQSDKPCMIGRFGSLELQTLCSYIGRISFQHSILRYIQHKEPEWFFDEKVSRMMQSNAGFFPITYDNLMCFGGLMLDCIKELDLLGSWHPYERYVRDFLSKDIVLSKLSCLEPWWAEQPWTRALEKKKVLVIHPFAELIEKMYNNYRTKLFKNQNVLPEFELITIKSVQTIGGIVDGYSNWFEALEDMKHSIEVCDFDIALIGCGAYGFPLAAHVKKIGKKSVHLGGALQLLFGIRGKRWDEREDYQSLFSNYWVHPGADYKPKTADTVEGGCYW